MDQVLQQVQLLDRAQHFARTYSGGMKRRLSVALSTVGDVQVIFFDGELGLLCYCVCFLNFTYNLIRITLFNMCLLLLTIWNEIIIIMIIMYSEPTTGLDPLSRRRVWETINSLKRDRVVVLTTHNMEEADFLGDTIMIMHGGRGAYIYIYVCYIGCVGMYACMYVCYVHVYLCLVCFLV